MSKPAIPEDIEAMTRILFGLNEQLIAMRGEIAATGAELACIIDTSPEPQRLRNAIGQAWLERLALLRSNGEVAQSALTAAARLLSSLRIQLQPADRH